jgi:hypothetical protein
VRFFITAPLAWVNLINNSIHQHQHNYLAIFVTASVFLLFYQEPYSANFRFVKGIWVNVFGIGIEVGL